MEELEGEVQRPDVLDTARMEALIAEHLNDRLQLLPELDLASALHDFVEKVQALLLSSCLPCVGSRRGKGVVIQLCSSRVLAMACLPAEWRPAGSC